MSTVNRSGARRPVLIVVMALLGMHCGGDADEAASLDEIPDRFTKLLIEEPSPVMAEEAEGEMDDWGGAPEEKMMAQGLAAAPKKRKRKEDRQAAPPPPADVDGAAVAEEGERVREWFPESFLWQPLVQTGPQGSATLDVRVPDQLTTWRVLALAHTREGQQSGAVHTFDSRMDVYVDPVVPGWLYAGDVIDLPVQVVNTTSASIDANLDVTASGVLTGGLATSVALGSNGSDVAMVPLVADGAGNAYVKATLPGSDAAERKITVGPTGRPVSTRRGGTLSGPRAFSMKSPPDVDPRTEELTVHVFPGPLAVLQAEVDRVGSGAETPWSAAYSFALANSLTSLSARAGADYDPKAVRRLKLLGWQRVIRHARAPNAGAAADLLAAMRGVQDHELAEELEARLVRTVVQGQRGGGDWGRQGGGSMQMIIAQTAFAARVLPDDQEGPRLRAAGAIERYQRDIEDPYTAAIVLASGLASGGLQTRLAKLVDDAVYTRDDGSHGIHVPSGVRNPWSKSPSSAEMLAWVSLARPEASYRGDLVAELMSGYDASMGFGAGPADVIALEAVVSALPGISKPVDIVLTVDGVEVGRQTLDPAQPKVPAVLTGLTKGSTNAIGLRAEPEVPGLAWVATLDSWVPWSGEERVAGVEIELDSKDFRVGRDSTLTVRMSAPSGISLTIEQGLPAGTSVDEAALAKLSGTLVSHSVQQDKITFTTKRFAAGEIIEVPLVVRPAFSGSFSTAPLTVSTNGGSLKSWLAPLRWEVGS